MAYSKLPSSPALIGLFLLPLLGQNANTRFMRLGMEEGISQNTIRAITQDQQGFMWFATQSGLNRYDGYKVSQFKRNHKKQTGISDNFVTSMLVDEAGFLWLGTLSGLDRYDPKKQTFVHFGKNPNQPDGQLEEIVNAIVAGRNGSIWVGTEPGGLFQIEPEEGTWEHLPHPALLEEGGVSALAAGSGGRIWIGASRGGLYFLDPGNQIRPYPSLSAEILARKGVVCLVEKNGALWLGTNGAGLFHVQLAPSRITSYSHDPENPWSIGSGIITSIFQTREGVLWIGTRGAGLERFDPRTGRFTHHRNRITDRYSLSDDKVYSIFVDSGGILWVGTNSGISKLRSTVEAMQHFRQQPENELGISHNRVKCFLEDRSGVFWVGTGGGGLNRLDREGNHVTVYRHDANKPESLGHDNVYALYEETPRRFWVATFGAGLDLFDPITGRFRHFRHEPDNENSLTHDQILSVHGVGEGKLWVGTRSGLDILDTRSERFSRVDNEALRNSFIAPIFTDKQARIWIGTFINGLFLYDKGVYTNFKHKSHKPNSLAHNSVRTVFQDHQGRIWVGTGLGLDRWEKNNKWTHFNEQHGLPNELVYGIQEDNAGFLWVSTNFGLARLDPERKIFRSFDLKDGIQGLEFNTGAVLKTSRGELAFGGSEGFNLFDPALLVANDHVPPVVFTSFKKLDKEWDPGQAPFMTRKLVLKPGEKVVSIEFAALDYANSEMNRYRFKLEGFNDSWQEDLRLATYTNLDPDTYTLRVQGANSDGLWNLEGASLELIVVAPFYAALWFKGLMVLALVAILFGWQGYQQQRQRHLQLIVDERTTSLMKSNRQLADTAENLNRTQHNVMISAHKIGMAEIATDVLHNIGNVLNSLMVSANVIERRLLALPIDQLLKISHLIEDHKDDLPGFFSDEKRARHFSDLLGGLTNSSARLRESASQEAENLTLRGHQITAILTSQRKYALDENFYEALSPCELMEDVLRIQGTQIVEHDIKVNREFETAALINAPKSKLLHVFNQLIKNSCEALMEKEGQEKRELFIGIRSRGGEVLISIRDNGTGIANDELIRIFGQGFSTKSKTRGFGLHQCSNAIREMGGNIYAHSEGPGKGAAFYLELPAV